MLSRIAQHVYWIGRFVERAENIARFVTAYHYSATQLGTLEDRSGLHDLIAALGEPGHGEVTFRATAGWWILDEENASSVCACIRAARDHARRAREVLSLEVWETLNAATAYLDRATGAAAGYEAVASEIPSYTRAFAGALDGTAPRDETWEILRAGTLIERAAMTVRGVLIGAQAAERLKPGDPLALHAWTVTLRACQALDAYRTTSVALPRGEEVIGLLFRSATCPRSVLYALREAQSLVPFDSDAAREIERARTLAESAHHDGRGIPAIAGALLGECDRIHDAIVREWRGAWEPV